MGFRHRVFLLIVVMLIVLLVIRTSGARVAKGDKVLSSNEGLWNSRLPRGPVPPSGPSPCHNMLGPYKQSQVVSPQDQIIICP
ncbi:hypothetical protein Lser_V15G37216 [Lactuca serriola]